MAQKFSDAARALLSGAITSSDTTIAITTGGSLFPVANTGASAISAAADWFKAVLQAVDGFEVIYVRTHTSGANSFTNVLRGQEGTTARAFAANDVVGIRPLSSDADAWTNLRVERTSSTGASKQPAGTTAQRDGSPTAGYFRFNSDTGAFEGYNGTAWQSIGASGMIGSVAELTATAGQTVFTTGYTAGLIDVYKNGARLGAADYVATNGTSVALVVGAALNDHIAVVKYVAGTISNAVAKSGDTMSGALNFAPRATVASASTTDVGAAAANGVSITGTTTITSLGTAASGIKRTLTFAGALVLTHNATSLILPGSANITTAEGDVAEFESLGSGNWRCTGYMRTSGQAEYLNGARTYYVRSDGSDANNGLANNSAGAFATIQKAVNVAASLNVGSNDVTIRCTGTFTVGAIFKSINGSGKIFIRGDANDNTTMQVAASSGDAFSFGPGFRGNYSLSWMKISSATGSCVGSIGYGGGIVDIANVEFGAASVYHIFVAHGQCANVSGPCTISGGALAIVRSTDSALVRMTAALTFTGTPAFVSALVVADRAAGIVANSATFSGSVTGNRYSVTTNGYIYTNGGGANFFPGSNVGASSTGGQYV